MSRGPLVLLLLTVVLGACDGSQNSASSTANSAAAPSAASSATTAASATKHKPSRNRSRGRSHSSGTKASNVRLPATYVIGEGGMLAPPLVSAPTGVTIDLTVVASDGLAHRVRLRSLNTPELVVPAGGRASARLGGLKAGSYGVFVDGVRRGALVIGAVPGP